MKNLKRKRLYSYEIVVLFFGIPSKIEVQAHSKNEARQIAENGFSVRSVSCIDTGTSVEEYLEDRFLP